MATRAHVEGSTERIRELDLARPERGSSRRAVHVVAGVALLAIAFAVRGRLLCGLILGDDPQEFAVLLQILTEGPLLNDQLHLRFGTWVANHLAFWLFGVSETAFLAPTWIVSSTFAVMAYALLVRWRYGVARAFLGGLAVATAPFEVVLGTLRANDLYLAWALGLGFLLLVFLEERPVLQGIGIALCFWFGFYVKLWVIYLLPPLALYYLVERRWRAALWFVVASTVVHGATCAFWWAKLGTPIPFLTSHAVNYKVPRAELVDLWLKYPRLIFKGSFEFPTTLFGAVPYVVVALLVVKAIGTWRRSATLRLDRGDALLVAFYGSFFLLVNFVPNGFGLDAYYSVPRIFRYLAPLSFPLALHAAKMLLDVAGAVSASTTAAVAVMVPVLALNVYQSAEATSEGRIYRAELHAVLHDVQHASPPLFIAESVMASYIRDLYFDPRENHIAVTVLITQHIAADYEQWLRDHQDGFPDGTMLLTGLGNFIHYGAHLDGFRLEWFKSPLDPRWHLVKEYPVLWYLPRPEPGRLWRFDRGGVPLPPDPVESVASLAGLDDPNLLLRGGMQLFDRGEYGTARVYFRKLMNDWPAQAEDASFFYAVSFLREGDWARSRREFKRLVRRFPNGRWLAASYWHIAMCDREAGRVGSARAGFAAIIRRFPNDAPTVNLARQDLERIRRRAGGVVPALWRRLVHGAA